MAEIQPFDPKTLFLIALLNPAVIAVAFIMGRKADQWQKLPIAAFAASLAGFLLFWIVAAVGTAAGAGLWRTAFAAVVLAILILLLEEPVDRLMRFISRRGADKDV